jgi:hypothetical protein
MNMKSRENSEIYSPDKDHKSTFKTDLQQPKPKQSAFELPMDYND